MRHRNRGLFIVTVALAVLVSNCCKQEPAPPVPAKAKSFASATVPAGGSLVKVAFQYAICHVFDGVNRAVVLRGDDQMKHAAFLVIPNDLTADGLTNLKTITGRNPSIVGGRLEIQLENVGVRVIDEANAAMQPALETGEDFDSLAPHLKMIGVRFTAVRDELKNDIPVSTDPIIAYFELNGGHLSADAQCSRAMFDAGPDDRRFADVVTLTGSTTKPAQLQLRSATQTSWTPVGFKHKDVLEVRIENRPDTTAGHFPIFLKLSKDTTATLPVITKTLSCEAGLSPGCSNTQWP
jgi:hypothetical protein